MSFAGAVKRFRSYSYNSHISLRRQQPKSELPTNPPIMSLNFHGIEPFPLYIDCSPSASPNYFSNVNPFEISLSATQTKTKTRSRQLTITKLSNYFFLRYYQYEVTFGLYMLSPTEKWVLNTIFVAILVALSCALWVGLAPFAVSMFCRVFYSVTGLLMGGRCGK